MNEEQFEKLLKIQVAQLALLQAIANSLESKGSPQNAEVKTIISKAETFIKNNPF